MKEDIKLGYSFQKDNTAQNYIKLELIGITLAFFGLVGIVLIYLFIVSPLNTKLNTLEESITKIEARIETKNQELTMLEEQRQGKILGAKESDKENAEQKSLAKVPEEANFHELIKNLSNIVRPDNNIKSELLEIKEDSAFTPHPRYSDLSILPLYISIKIDKSEINSLLERFENSKDQLFEIVYFEASEFNESTSSTSSNSSSSSSSSSSNTTYTNNSIMTLRIKLNTFYGFATQNNDSSSTSSDSSSSGLLDTLSSSKESVKNYYGGDNQSSSTSSIK